MSSPAAPRTADGSVQAGRGGLAIAAAKLYFIVLGFAQQSLLNHLLGASYGTYRRAQSFATIVYNPVVTSGVQGVSRSVSSASPEERPAATRRSVLIQALSVQPLALAFFLLAPQLSRALHAEHLTTSFRILAGVIALYGVYAPLVGVLNGQRRFVAQAALDSIFATLRTLGLAAGAFYFGRVGRMFGAAEGSLLGFVTAAALIVVISIPVAGLGAPGWGGVTLRRQLAFLAPLYLGQFTLNLLMQSDIHLLGRFAADAAVQAGLDAREADRLVGAYGVAQLFCFLPYQLLLSVTFVLFPLLASARRDGDDAAVASYVRTGVRLALVIAGAFVAVNAGLAGRLLAVVFRAEDAALGGEAMLALALGLGSFAIFGILATVLTSLGRERLSALLTAAALTLVVAASVLLVRGTSFGPAMLTRTALATSLGLVTATLLSALAVKKTAGGVVAPLTVVRVLVATALGVTLGRVLGSSLPASKVLTLGLAGAIGLAYLGLLIATRELGRADLNLMLGLVRKKRPA
jgi:stage V sporulation protein B